MVGMQTPTSSNSDSTRSILYSSLTSQFPHVPPQTIFDIIEKHGYDAHLCRQLVQDISSRANPVFNHIHNVPVQPGPDGYRWPVTMTPPMSVVERQRSHATNDSGVHTLSPNPHPNSLGLPILSVSPSVSPTSSMHTSHSPTPSGCSSGGKHSRNILTKMGKHFGIGKKQAPAIFVPAPVQQNNQTGGASSGSLSSNASSNGLRAPPSATPSTSSPSSPTPPPRRSRTPHSGSVTSLSMDTSGPYDDVADTLGGRRTSAPARPPLPNHSRPFVPMAHLSNMTPLNPLSIDTTGHSPTAGNGYDYAMGTLAENPHAFDDDMMPRSISAPDRLRTGQNSRTSSSSNITPLEAQRIHFERLRGVLDANRVLQKELELDMESLTSFKIIQLKDMVVKTDVSPDDLEAVKKENATIQNEIDELRRKIASYERISGMETPPQLPPKPQPRPTCSRSTSDEQWACLRCTALNHAELPRCELCLLPRIIPKPPNEAVASVSGLNASAMTAPCYCCNNSNASRQSTDRSPNVEYERLTGMAPPADQPMDTTDGGDGGWVMVDVTMGPLPPAPPTVTASHM